MAICIIDLAQNLLFDSESSSLMHLLLRFENLPAIVPVVPEFSSTDRINSNLLSVLPRVNAKIIRPTSCMKQTSINGGSIRYIPIVIVMVMGDNFRFQFLIIRIFVVAILKLEQALFLCYSKKKSRGWDGGCDYF